MLKLNNSKDGRPYRVFESFSGIGAQAMALKTSSEPARKGGRKRRPIPYEIVGTSDISKHANEAYNAIYADTGWDPSRNLGDITRIQHLPDCDILTYSFPCQSLSKSNTTGKKGMREGSGTESSLIWEVRRLIADARPEWLLMENVTQIHNKNNLPEFERWIDTLSDMGYTSKWADLNAKDFGLPQNRRRTFLLSHLGPSCPDLPSGTAPAPPLSQLLEGGWLEDYALDDRKLSDHLYPLRAADLKKTLPWKNASKAKYLEAEEGDGLEMQFVGRARGTVKKGLAPTLLTSGDTVGVAVRRPDGVLTARRFTPREAFRLQGFPDWAYDRVAASGQTERQMYAEAGNSIAVPVLREIFRTIDDEEIRQQRVRK